MVDKIQGHQQLLELLDPESDIGRWRPPTGTPQYQLGIKVGLVGQSRLK
jgi:hypothetical protein